MITVYVESNFVLELVLEQAEHEACEAILKLASQIDLAIPAFALIEPYQTIERHRDSRRVLAQQVDDQLKYLQRTRSLAEQASDLKGVFARAEQRASEEYARVRTELTQRARLLPLTADVWSSSTVLLDRGLRLPDAVMLATVLGDPNRQSGGACFLNSDAKDFAAFGDDLDAIDCKLIPRFSDGLRFINGRIGEAR